jgi:hypothetical protein
MKSLLWFVFGIVVALSAQTFAQYWENNDPNGTRTYGWTNPNGGMQYWQDNQGRQGSFYSSPGNQAPLLLPHNPC